MRRVICFLLVLAMCLSMGITAFAAPPSAADSGRPSYSGSNPKTGDIIMTWAIIMILALVALVAVVVLYRKVFAK